MFEKISPEEFLRRWYKGLETYGVPRDFADSTEVIHLANPQNNLDISAVVIAAEGYFNRDKLIKQIIKKPKNDCFLCDNIEQALSGGGNLILEDEDYIVMPNKFPMFKSHALLCAKKHDIQRKDILESYLDILVYAADKYNLLVNTNHSLTGMSISGHEHSHIYPQTFINKDGSSVCLNGLEGKKLKETAYGKSIFSVPESRLNTLAFVGKSSRSQLIRAVNRMDSAGIIYTLVYSPGINQHPSREGMFFLTQHEKENKKIGAGAPIYHLLVPSKDNGSYEELIRRFNEYFHKKEENIWKNLLED